MKKLTAAALLAGLGFGALGCNSVPWLRDRNTAPPADPASNATFTKRDPQSAELVEFMNANARRVQALQCVNVDMDCRQGKDTPVGIAAMLVCEKPRNFRLKGTALGKPVVDLGSNADEFWFWVNDMKTDSPPLYRCAYTDMATGQARMPFPFNPDMVVCALNIAEYKPNARYEVRSDAHVIELIEPTKSLQGQDVFKVTVFNRGQVTPSRPRVLAYLLKDKQGKDICTASILETQVNQATGAVLPVKVKIVFHGDGVVPRSEMTMKFTDLQPTTITKERGEALFTRKELSHLQSVDLARLTERPTGNPQSFQRTGGVER